MIMQMTTPAYRLALESLVCVVTEFGLTIVWFVVLSENLKIVLYEQNIRVV